MSKRTDEERSWKKSLEDDFPKKRGDWIVLERETWIGKYSLKVHHDRVTRPDGNLGVYEWVEIGQGVSILPLDTERNVYLAEGFQYGLGTNSLEIAGGGIDPGEKPQQAAERELREELGIKSGQLISLGVLNQITGLLYSPQYLFLAKDICFEDIQQELTEKITRVKMPLEQAVSYAVDSRIHDAPAVVTILRANEYFRNKTLS